MMRRIALSALVIFTIWGGIPVGGSGGKKIWKSKDDDPPSARVIFSDLRTEVERVSLHSVKFVEIEKKVGPVFARLPKQIDVLERANEHTSMPKEYLAALYSEVLLFRKIDVTSPAKKDAEILYDISDDLENKVIATDAKINGGKPYRVKVIANTRDAQQKPVKGLEVVYVQKGYVKEEKRHKKFLTLSTPTEQELIPGNWVIWATDGKAKGGAKDLPVRPQNWKKEIEVDIAAP